MLLLSSTWAETRNIVATLTQRLSQLKTALKKVLGYKELCEICPHRVLRMVREISYNLHKILIKKSCEGFHSRKCLCSSSLSTLLK